MNTQIEQTPIAPHHRKAVDTLATALLNIEDETTSRASVAEIVRQHGFAAYVGGHHVAVHRKHTTGLCAGPRIAMITHTSPDFN